MKPFLVRDNKTRVVKIYRYDANVFKSVTTIKSTEQVIQKATHRSMIDAEKHANKMLNAHAFGVGYKTNGTKYTFPIATEKETAIVKNSGGEIITV